MRGPASSGRTLAAPARGVLIAGTTSDAGKSFVTTGLCRLFARRGWRVAPFKAANMSLNACAADDGGEMASAQWVQCRAAGFPALTVCNPVLYKSEGPRGVEVIVRGRVRYRSASWRRTMSERVPELREEVRRALGELLSQERFLVAEGAGSPAEVNLRRTDLSNMDVARALDAPVLLIADLERGGALAQVVGTLQLLPPSERRRVRGLVLNRMQGDERLLEGAVRFLERKTGVPVLGVLPVLPSDLPSLPPEDALSLRRALPARIDLKNGRTPRSDRAVRIGLLRLPHVSNFSDFHLLESTPGASTQWVDDPATLGALDTLVLPGSRRTVDDLAWLRERGWEEALRSAVERGVRIVGICGGYQILGERLIDPRGFEGPRGVTPGLGLLPLTTTFHDPKLVQRVEVAPDPSNLWCPPNARARGFEIRRGRSTLRGKATPVFHVHSTSSAPRQTVPDGAALPGGRLWGTAVHGLLNDPIILGGFLRWARGAPAQGAPTAGASPVDGALDRAIDHVADLLEEHLDLEELGRILGRSLAP